MVRGLYTACTGMTVQAKKLDIISNDMANANTTGYKKDVAIMSSFNDVLMSKIKDNEVAPIGNVSLGVRVDSVYTAYDMGSLVKTDDALNMAIQGDGFFTVQTNNGVAYTRDGGFVVDANGGLVTAEGYAVIGSNGAINLGNYLESGGDITVSGNGQIRLNGELIDTLQIVSFQDNQQLQKREDNLYTAGGQTQPFQGSVLSGYLESSNVNIVTTMVDMINVSRAYEANQKMIQTQDSLLGKAVNDLGQK